MEDDTHLFFVYSPEVDNWLEGMEVVVPSIMGNGDGSFDDLVPSISWVLPYALEQACGASCNESPDNRQSGSTCDAAVAERSTPFLRRNTDELGFGGIRPNPGSRWVIRSGRTVVWDAQKDFYNASSLILFQGGACINVEGRLRIDGISMTANEAFAPWRGIKVAEGGRFQLSNASLSYAGNLTSPVVPAAIQTDGGRIILDDAILTLNFARGVRVLGDRGSSS